MPGPMGGSVAGAPFEKPGFGPNRPGISNKKQEN